MSSFKLEYFPSRYFGEPARLLLHYVGQKFEDHRTDREKEWDTRKETTPFGTIPVLTVDGVQIGQSSAIYHYLARRFGLEGKGELEIATVNALGDYLKDFMNANLPYVIASFRQPDDVERLKTEVLVPNLHKYLPKFVSLLKASKSDFFADSGLTWVDFAISEYFDSMSKAAPEVTGKYTELQEHSKRVHSLPQLQSYLSSRPVTPW
ncbi:hypothetical protein FO519_007961 [Halicephalobus sp. NKZ332]|nr:hypothetical protein FO519_007961 [Halicephalobus sp. NKZ332]